METSAKPAPGPPAFTWNAGGWFGSQAGCTLWMLILGLVLMPRSAPVGASCLAGFLVLNAWGVLLWQARERVSAYAAIQAFLLVASLVVAAIVVLVRVNGLSEREPGALVSTDLPWGVLLVCPLLMFFFHLRERASRRG